jgi:hypothetical protein
VEKVKIRTTNDKSLLDNEKVVVKKQTTPVPAHLAAILAMRKADSTPSETLSGNELATPLEDNDSSLEPDPSRSLVGIEWDKQARLVLEFDNGDKLVSKPVPVNEIRSSVVVSTSNPNNNVTGVAEAFETVSKNLPSSDAVYAYLPSGDLYTITYSNGVVKTFNYTSNLLSSIVLSGTTPSGIELTKSLTYSVNDLVAVTYS